MTLAEYVSQQWVILREYGLIKGNGYDQRCRRASDPVGKWVWQETGVPRCGSPMLAIMRDNVAMERCLSASISDDDAMLIDGLSQGWGGETKRWLIVCVCTTQLK